MDVYVCTPYVCTPAPPHLAVGRGVCVARTSRRIVVVGVYGRRARVGIARIARQRSRARSRTRPRVVGGGIIIVIVSIIIGRIGVETVREASSRDGDGGVAVQGAR